MSAFEENSVKKGDTSNTSNGSTTPHSTIGSEYAERSLITSESEVWLAPDMHSPRRHVRSTQHERFVPLTGWKGLVPRSPPVTTMI